MFSLNIFLCFSYSSNKFRYCSRRPSNLSCHISFSPVWDFDSASLDSTSAILCNLVDVYLCTMTLFVSFAPYTKLDSETCPRFYRRQIEASTSSPCSHLPSPLHSQTCDHFAPNSEYRLFAHYDLQDILETYHNLASSQVQHRSSFFPVADPALSFRTSPRLSPTDMYSYVRSAPSRSNTSDIN